MGNFIFFFSLCFSLYGGDLHRAIQRGEELEAELIITSSADPKELDKPDYEGKSPAYLAVQYNQIGILKLLIASKAGLNLACRGKVTPIILAFKEKNYPILSFFQEHSVKLESDLFYEYLLGKAIPRKVPDAALFDNFNSAFLGMLKDVTLHNSIIFTYAFGYTDVEFFEKMLQICKECPDYKPLISNVLRELSFEGFVQGMPPQEALKKLAQLMDEIETSHPLRLKLWNTIEQMGQQVEAPAYSNPLKGIALADARVTAQSIAEAITELSEFFLRAVSPREIMAWMRDDDSGDGVQRMAQFSRRITNWFAFCVASEADDKVRGKLVKKILLIGQELFKLRNFWGVAQIVSALSRGEIRRLISGKNARKIHLEINKLTELVSPEQNYRSYRASIVEHVKHHRVFPNIDVICGDFKRAFETRPKDLSSDWLKQMASMFKGLHDYKTKYALVLNKNRLLVAFLFHVPTINDETIEAYSDLRMPWPLFKDRTSQWQSKNLESWNGHDLVSFLMAKNLRPCIAPLLEARLWDGGQINKYLFLNKAMKNGERVYFLMDNGVPVELANELEMMLFLAL